jgi:hypothetical protein
VGGDKGWAVSPPGFADELGLCTPPAAETCADDTWRVSLSARRADTSAFALSISFIEPPCAQHSAEAIPTPRDRQPPQTAKGKS